MKREPFSNNKGSTDQLLIRTTAEHQKILSAIDTKGFRLRNI